MVSGGITMSGPLVMMPGEMAEVQVELIAPVYLEPGMPFLLRDGNQGPVAPKDQPPRWAGSSGMGRVISVVPVTT